MARAKTIHLTHLDPTIVVSRYRCVNTMSLPHTHENVCIPIDLGYQTCLGCCIHAPGRTVVVKNLELACRVRVPGTIDISITGAGLV